VPPVSVRKLRRVMPLRATTIQRIDVAGSS
jgi:hypothetical protein